MVNCPRPVSREATHGFTSATPWSYPGRPHDRAANQTVDTIAQGSPFSTV